MTDSSDDDSISDGARPAIEPISALRSIRSLLAAASDLVDDAIGVAKDGGPADFAEDLRNAADHIAGVITEIEAAIAAAEEQTGS